MLAFACDNCGQVLFFENSVCLRCGASLGFQADQFDIVGLDTQPQLRTCENLKTARCNWLLTPAESGPLCRSCALTRTRPADWDSTGLDQFGAAESAKRRLLFQLYDLRLPIEGDLHFDLLSSRLGAVTTGHEDGLITIDLAESDDVRRVQRQAQLGEPYRTLLGHFRHEIGHYYEPILVDRSGQREAFRTLFGPETLDYQKELERHYEQGPPADWAQRHVSSYATMHPSEDWAETFAHYLHIRDTLQTAAAFGVRVTGPEGVPDESVGEPENGERPFAKLMEVWLPLTYALNAVNRSMGSHDLYPFTLAAAVIDKLSFVHDRVLEVAATTATG
jgi:hypothetical protein